MRTPILTLVTCALALTLGGSTRAADEATIEPARAAGAVVSADGCEPSALASREAVVVSQVKLHKAPAGAKTVAPAQVADPAKAGEASKAAEASKRAPAQMLERPDLPVVAPWGRLQGDTVHLNSGYTAQATDSGAASVMKMGAGPGGSTTSIVLDVFCKCVTGDVSRDDAPGCVLGVFKDGTIRCSKEGAGCGGQCKADTRPPPKVQIQ